MEHYKRLYDDWHEDNYHRYSQDLIKNHQNLKAPILRYSKFHLFALYILNLLKQFKDWRHFKKILYSFVVLFILFFNFESNYLAIILSAIAVLLYLPMSHNDYIGFELSFSAMIIISSAHGFATGVVIGKIPNLIGHFITHKIDLDVVYELILFAPIAYISSLFSLSNVLFIGLVITLLYDFGYVLYFWYSGLFNWKTVSYASTHFIFNSLVLINLIPLLLNIGF